MSGMNAGRARFQPRQVAGQVWPLLHALAFGCAAAVPVAAIGYAVADAVTSAGAGSLADWLTLSRWLALLGTTAAVVTIALLVALPLGTLGGYLLARTDLPARRLLLALLALLAALPVYVQIVFVGALLPLWQMADSVALCGLLHGLFAAPLAVLIMTATFRHADATLEDLARLDAGPWSVAVRVTVPQARWGLAAVALLLLVLIATDFTIADVLAVRTFAEEVYTQFALHRAAAGPVLAALPAVFALGGILTVALLRWQHAGPGTVEAGYRAPATVALGKWRRPLFIACVLVLTGLLGPPLVGLVRRVESVRALASAARGVWPEVLTSAQLAPLAGLLILAFSVGLAVCLASRRRLRWLVLAGCVLLLAMPAPVIGIALIRLLNRPGLLGWLYDSPLVIIIAWWLRFLPVGVLLLLPAVQGVPAARVDAARLDGCGWTGLQWHVYWPASWGTALLAGLIVMILSFGEVATTMLVVPPGWSTVAVRAFTLIHFGVYADLAVLALLAAGVLLIPWSLLLWIWRCRMREVHQ